MSRVPELPRLRWSLGGTASTVGALVLGATVGVLALVVHRAGSAVPWGLVLGCASSAAGSVGLRALGLGPVGLTAYGAGWCVVVLTVLAGRPEGDYLVGGDARGGAFLVAGAGSVVVVTALGVAASSRADR